MQKTKELGRFQVRFKQKTVKVEGGHTRTWRERTITGYEIKTEFIPEKKESSLQPNEGWARSTFQARSTKFRIQYHYFRKDDLLSLCGLVKLEKNFQFLTKDQMFSNKECKHCMRILSKYNDIQNMVRSEATHEKAMIW